MGKINSIDELYEKINFLELKRSNDLNLLKEQAKISYESIKPINLIQNSLKEFSSSLNFKKELLNTSISLGVGYLSKKIAVGSTKNPLKQLLGTVVQMGVTNLVSKNTEAIKSVTKNLIYTLFKKNITP